MHRRHIMTKLAMTGLGQEQGLSQDGEAKLVKVVGFKVTGADKGKDSKAITEQSKKQIDEQERVEKQVGPTKVDIERGGGDRYPNALDGNKVEAKDSNGGENGHVSSSSSFEIPKRSNGDTRTNGYEKPDHNGREDAVTEDKREEDSVKRDADEMALSNRKGAISVSDSDDEVVMKQRVPKTSTKQKQSDIGKGKKENEKKQGLKIILRLENKLGEKHETTHMIRKGKGNSEKKEALTKDKETEDAFKELGIPVLDSSSSSGEEFEMGEEEIADNQMEDDALENDEVDSNDMEKRAGQRQKRKWASKLEAYGKRELPPRKKRTQVNYASEGSMDEQEFLDSSEEVVHRPTRITRTAKGEKTEAPSRKARAQAKHGSDRFMELVEISDTDDDEDDDNDSNYKPASKGRRRAVSMKNASHSLPQSLDDSDNDDFCHVCAEAGDLICCDTCSRVVHVHCDPRLNHKIPGKQESYFCSICRALGVGGEDIERVLIRRSFQCWTKFHAAADVEPEAVKTNNDTSAGEQGSKLVSDNVKSEVAPDQTVEKKHTESTNEITLPGDEKITANPDVGLLGGVVAAPERQGPEEPAYLSSPRLNSGDGSEPSLVKIHVCSEKGDAKVDINNIVSKPDGAPQLVSSTDSAHQAKTSAVKPEKAKGSDQVDNVSSGAASKDAWRNDIVDVSRTISPKSFKMDILSLIKSKHSKESMMKLMESTNETMYYVKLRDKGYIHNVWIPESCLSRTGRKALLRVFKFSKPVAAGLPRSDPETALVQFESYLQTAASSSMSISSSTLEPVPTVQIQLHSDWFFAERILAVEEDECFVKWHGLTYNECTWESLDTVKTRFPEVYGRYQDFYVPKTKGEGAAFTTESPNSRPSKKSEVAKFQDSKQPVFLSSKGSLFDYQVEGFNWLLSKWFTHQNAILADEMGLGKTVQAIAYIAALHHLGHRFPHLVIAPLSTIPNWMREFEEWAPQLYVVNYGGPLAARKIIHEFELSRTKLDPSDPRKMKANVVITTYENIIADSKSDNMLYRLRPFQSLVIDEGHRLKGGQGTKIFKLLSRFTNGHSILMTGTPLQNSLKELFNLLEFLDPGLKSENLETKVKDSSNPLELLQDLIRPRMLRRTKESINLSLPPKVEVEVPVPMSLLQRKCYRAILSKNYNVLREGKMKRSLTNVLSELRLCCCHPYLVSDEPVGLSEEQTITCLIRASGKLSLLDEMLKEFKTQGHRVLLFSQFKLVLNVIEDFLFLKHIEYERLDGDVSHFARQQAIDRFNDKDSKTQVFLLSTRAGGTGINLATADTVIIFDSDFNPQQDLQALARAHRIGQVNRLMVYRLVTVDSVEEKILERAKSRLELDHVVRVDEKESTEDEVQVDAGALSRIIQHGAARLFGMEEADKAANDDQFKYDTEKLSWLLDRDLHHGKQAGAETDKKVMLSSTSAKDALFSKSAENAWDKVPEVKEYVNPDPAVGNVDAVLVGDGPVSSLGEMMQQKAFDEDGLDSGKFWDDLLRSREILGKQRELETFGRGKRVRNQVNYNFDVVVEKLETNKKPNKRIKRSLDGAINPGVGGNLDDEHAADRDNTNDDEDEDDHEGPFVEDPEFAVDDTESSGDDESDVDDGETVGGGSNEVNMYGIAKGPVLHPDDLQLIQDSGMMMSRPKDLRSVKTITSIDALGRMVKISSTVGAPTTASALPGQQNKPSMAAPHASIPRPTHSGKDGSTSRTPLQPGFTTAPPPGGWAKAPPQALHILPASRARAPTAQQPQAVTRPSHGDPVVQSSTSLVKKVPVATAARPLPKSDREQWSCGLMVKRLVEAENQCQASLLQYASTAHNEDVVYLSRDFRLAMMRFVLSKGLPDPRLPGRFFGSIYPKLLNEKICGKIEEVNRSVSFYLKDFIGKFGSDSSEPGGLIDSQLSYLMGDHTVALVDLCNIYDRIIGMHCVREKIIRCIQTKSRIEVNPKSSDAGWALSKSWAAAREGQDDFKVPWDRQAADGNLLFVLHMYGWSDWFDVLKLCCPSHHDEEGLYLIPSGFRSLLAESLVSYCADPKAPNPFLSKIRQNLQARAKLLVKAVCLEIAQYRLYS